MYKNIKLLTFKVSIRRNNTKTADLPQKKNDMYETDFYFTQIKLIIIIIRIY